MEDSSGQLPEAFSEVGRKTGIQLKQLRTFCDSREPSPSPKVGDGSRRVRGSVMAAPGFHLEAPEERGSNSRRARGSIMVPGFHMDGEGSKGSSGRTGKRATVSGFSRADLESGREGFGMARNTDSASANWRKVRNLVSAAGQWQNAADDRRESVGRRSSGASQSPHFAGKHYPASMTLTDSNGHHTANSMGSGGAAPPIGFATTTPHGSVNVMNLTGGVGGGARGSLASPTASSPVGGGGGVAGSLGGTAKSSLVGGGAGLRMDPSVSNMGGSSIPGSPNHAARGSNVAGSKMVNSSSTRHKAAAAHAAAIPEEDEESSKPRMSRKMRIGLGEDVPPPRPPPPELPWTCFSSGGMDRRRFCERAVAYHSRWVFPAKSEEHPDGLHYKPNLKQVVSRQPEWEFGERAKHPSRKIEVGDINTEDPYAHINLQSPLFCASLRAASAPANGVQPLSVKPPRKPLNSSVGRSAAFFFHTPILEPTEWSQQDKASSLRQDPAVADFGQYAPRTSKKPHSYFDPGKCTVQSVSPKNTVNMSKSVSRMPPGSLQSEGAGMVPDRSLYRGCNTKSITHVSDFSNDSERPPLMKPPEVYYDESNPEVSEAWLAHRLTYDPSTADRAIMRRHDQSPNIGKCSTREHSRGGRLLETDKSFIAAIGKGDKVPAANLDLDKEDPSRARRDLGVARFEHYSSREPQRQQGECSALRRPRSMAAPDFARTARKGFLAKTSLRRLAPPLNTTISFAAGTGVGAGAGDAAAGDSSSVITAVGGLGSTLERVPTSRSQMGKSGRGTSARSRTKESDEEASQAVPYWCSELVDEDEAKAPPHFPTEWPYCSVSAEAQEAA